MLAPMKTTYLQKMGITVWRMRQAEEVLETDDASTPVEMAGFFCQLKNTNGDLIVSIVADIDPLVDTVSQKNLLQKIATALTPNHVVCEGNLFDYKVLFEKAPHVILLGKAVEFFLGQNTEGRQYITAPSLRQLEASPPDKKALWVKIKSLRDLLS